jgi:diaminohydroxyphosphoribosylaminopyrimidine deaminase/5-amino-6-(5-phosphoribosylamino)uracil reductase
VILVGIGTVLNDDPALTTRGVPVLRNTCVAVLDTHLQLPARARLIDGRDIVAYTSATAPAAAERRLGEMRVLVRRILTHDQDRVSIPAVLADLGEPTCTHVLVEPGPRLAKSFLEGNFADRVWVIRSPSRIEALTAPKAVAVPDHFVETGTIDLAGDTLTEYLNPNSDVFFEAEASADFVLGSPTSSRP